MRLKVTFMGEKEHAIAFPPRELGLNWVDRVREVTGTPDLPLEQIRGTTLTLFKNPVVEIPEELARKSGYFWEKSSIEVRVPDKSLNRFVYLTPEKSDYDKFTVLPRWVLDEEALLTAWKEAGFPLRWDPALKKGVEV